MKKPSSRELIPAFLDIPHILRTEAGRRSRLTDFRHITSSGQPGMGIIQGVSGKNVMNKNERTTAFLHGLRDGLPIGAGYFAVAFGVR